MICRSSAVMKKHYDNEHKFEQVSSREVCYHWRRGNCTKTNCRYAHVGYQTNKESLSTNKSTTRVPACKNGPSCDWLKKGSCSYFHTKVGVQRPWVSKRQDQGAGQVESRGQGCRQEDRGLGGRQEGRGQGGRQEGRGHGGRQESRDQGGRQDQLHPTKNLIQPDRLKCRFDGRCERIPNCPFIHSLEDFPLLQRGRTQGARCNPTQRRS